MSLLFRKTRENLSDPYGIQTMKTRKYLNVGPLHDRKAGEFFDRLANDYFTEHELGQKSLGQEVPEYAERDYREVKIIEFPRHEIEKNEPDTAI